MEKETFVSDSEKDFINRFGKITKKWGLDECDGIVLGILFFSEKSLSEKEIIEKTNYVSDKVLSSLNLLKNIGIVYETKKNKDILFEINMSYIDVTKSFTKKLIGEDLNPLVVDLKKYEFESKTKQKKVDKFVKDYEKIKKLLKLFETLSKLKK